jgi:hypothetical protein
MQAPGGQCEFVEVLAPWARRTKSGNMGYDISGISQARRIVGRHSDEACTFEDHYMVGRSGRFFEGRKPGCYVAGGRWYGFCLSYGGFETWLENLCQIMWNVSAGEVWHNRRRYRGEPFFELITLPESNDVGVGPNHSAKLLGDFVVNAAKVKRGFQRIWSESSSQPPAKRPRAERMPVKQARRLANALGGLLVDSADDPESLRWEWKWQVYCDFRRALRLASNDGLLIVSM